MKQTISGANMRDVIEQVRLQFGDDALIVSQHSRGGRAEVVVDDGHDGPDAHAFERGSNLASSARRESRPEAAQSDSKLVSSRRSHAGLAPEFSSKARALGFTEWFVSGLDVSIANDAELRSHILARVPLLTVEQPMTGVWRLLGSSGVGKTSATIKLLAARVLRYGTTGVRVVSADNRRLAGHETLLAAAELLSCEPTVLGNEELLSPALGRVGPHELVLIDSSQRSLAEVEQSPPRRVSGVSDLVVVPATWRQDVMRRYLMAFPEGQIGGVIVTHVDEMPQISPLVSLLAELDIPLLALSMGTGLPDSLELATPGLVESLLFYRREINDSADDMGKPGLRTTLRQSSGRFA